MGVEKNFIIGATKFDRSKSELSNYGKCIDATTLGEGVISSYPNDFYSVVSGTSFAAPLAVRYLTRKLSNKTVKSDMEKMLRSEKITWPKELTFGETMPYLGLTGENTVIENNVTLPWKF